MKKFSPILAILAFIFLSSFSFAQSSNTQTFSSDSVGVKLEYPSNWEMTEFRWGFVITEPETSASVTIQTFFMPKELEDKYEINMNEEYEKIYFGKYENRDKGEKEISGLTWDYTVAKGAINTDIEYIDISCSVLVENTVYMIQIFYSTNVDDSIKKQTEKIVESVKLMYRTVELPMINRYHNEWKLAQTSSSKLNYTKPAGLFEIKYAPPWIFLGGGSNTEAAFYYIAEDPFKDIGMFFVELPIDNPMEALNVIQDISALYTTDYSHVHETIAVFNETDFIKRQLTQGQGENVQSVRMFATEHKGRSLIAVFSYLREDADINQDMVIDDFMSNLSLL